MSDNSKISHYQRVRHLANILIIVSIIVTAFYFANHLLMSVILSAFIALALLPVSNKLESAGLPRLAATIFVVIITALVLVGISLIYILQAQAFAQDIPSFSGNIQQEFNQVVTFLSESLNLDASSDTWGSKIIDGSKKIAPQIFGLISTLILYIISVPVYTFFMLLYRDNFTAFIRRSADTQFEMNEKEVIVSEVKSSIQSYLKGMGIVLFIVAILSCTAFTLLGLPYPILLGVSSALLTLIPYLGVYLGAIIPALIALATKDSYWYPLGVILACAFIQFLEGNFITPKVVGEQVNLNPLAVILSLMVFGFVAGIIGMILAVPIVAVLKVLLDHSKENSHYALLLGSEVQINSSKGKLIHKTKKAEKD